MGNLSMNDRIRIANADLSDVEYIVEDGKIYFIESQLRDIINEYQIESAENLCAKMAEDFTNGAITEYAVICDDIQNHDIGLVKEFYFPNTLAPDMDPIMESCAMLIAFNEGTSLTNEMVWMTISRMLEKFKKGDYESAGTVQYRLNKCKNELANMEKELANLQNNPNKKHIQAVYTVKALVESIIRLAGTILVPIVSGKVGNAVSNLKLPQELINAFKAGFGLNGDGKPSARAIGISVIRGISNTINAASYESYLKKYIAELKKCIEYLEKEKKYAISDDKYKKKEQKVLSAMESSYMNPKSIAEIGNCCKY